MHSLIEEHLTRNDLNGNTWIDTHFGPLLETE